MMKKHVVFALFKNHPIAIPPISHAIELLSTDIISDPSLSYDTSWDESYDLMSSYKYDPGNLSILPICGSLQILLILHFLWISLQSADQSTICGSIQNLEINTQ